MITKYRTGRFGSRNKPIEEIQVERETEHSVWINGSRNKKNTDSCRYWDTYDEAKDYLVKKQELDIQRAENNLERKRKEYDRLKGLLK